jgi:large subunit ribosomal protein L5
MKQEIIHKTDYQKETRDFLEKIVVNAGIGRLSQQQSFEEKILPQISRDTALLCGQKPQVRRARKSIAGFKTRQGQIVGLRATLRGRKMVDFFERLIKIVLPRVRDFRGLASKLVDAGGALNIGFKEQFVFPEIEPEESPFTFSLGINIVPRKKNREAAIEAYRRLGVPLKS